MAPSGKSAGLAFYAYVILTLALTGGGAVTARVRLTAKESQYLSQQGCSKTGQ